MVLLARIPPGRAGRLWLRRRLRTAAQGRDQLDRKLRILLPELERRRSTADGRREQWTAACVDARTWLLRAALLGGQDALRCAAPVAPARVVITWTTSMGVRYPDDAQVASPVPATGGPSGAATAPAAAAVRAALAAGVATAAAEQAVRRLEAEVAVTRRRLRALDTRWLPSLQAALAGLELSLAQAEQEDGVRLRRAGPAAARGRGEPG